MFDDVGSYVEGEMAIPNKQNNLGSPEFNTLDEPIRDTIVTKFPVLIFFLFHSMLHFSFEM